MPNDLTGQFIANTFQNLIQKPDLGKEFYYNGIGATISVINRDAIGTIKMFYPNVLGATAGTHFETSTGLGKVDTDWEGWSICDSRNGTPDLRGQFIVGYSNTDSRYVNIGLTAGNDSVTIISSNLPPHKHEFNYSRFSFDVGHAIDNGDAVGNINNGGVPDYDSGNGDTNLGPTDPSGGTPQTSIDIRPRHTILMYVMRVY